MDDLLIDYIETNFTQELSQELLKSLQLFDHFNYKAIYEKVFNRIMDAHNQDSAELRDNIVLDIREGLNFIFKAHTILVYDDASIANQNELLTALALLMRLEDYQPILTVLDSMESDEEILASIICDLCSFDEVKLFTVIREFNPDLLETIKTYAQGKTLVEDVDDLGRERSSCIDSLAVFKELYGEDALGVQMLKSQAIVGAPFRSYIPFIENDMVGQNHEQTAKNFLSVLLLSGNGNNAPIITYKKYVERFINSIEEIQKIEPIMLKMINEIENYRRAKHDQKRVPQASI